MKAVRPFLKSSLALTAAGWRPPWTVGTIGIYVGLRLARTMADLHHGRLAATLVPIADRAGKALRKSRPKALRGENYAEAMLSLEMVISSAAELPAGLALAAWNSRHYPGQVADHLRRLMRCARSATANWPSFGIALLARGAYGGQTTRHVLNGDQPSRATWLRCSFPASRPDELPAILALCSRSNPHLADWCTELITTEQQLLLHQQQIPRAASPDPLYRQPASGYIPFSRSIA